MSPLTDDDRRPKGIRILWYNELGVPFYNINIMTSKNNIQNNPYWIIPFAVHTDASDKHQGAVISKKIKQLTFNQVY